MAKSMRRKSIDERIEALEQWLHTLKNIRDTEPKDMGELICKKYVEIGNVREVKTCLDELGCHFSLTTISEMIDKADFKVNIFAGEAKRMLSEGRKVLGIRK
jgi:hypothetical protein